MSVPEALAREVAALHDECLRDLRRAMRAWPQRKRHLRRTDVGAAMAAALIHQLALVLVGTGVTPGEIDGLLDKEFAKIRERYPQSWPLQ